MKPQKRNIAGEIRPAPLTSAAPQRTKRRPSETEIIMTESGARFRRYGAVPAAAAGTVPGQKTNIELDARRLVRFPGRAGGTTFASRQTPYDALSASSACWLARTSNSKPPWSVNTGQGLFRACSVPRPRAWRHPHAASQAFPKT